MRSLAMESASMNPYEQQLYTVFKTFDVDNEEALDKSAVLDLCDALQLEDRGAALVGTLFERSADRVTFTQFRNGLLSVLSDSGPEPGPAASTPRPAPAPAPATAPAHSDEDSSGREVAPKFVFGSKKYGRRSRPQRGSGDAHAPRAASVSRLDADDGRARSHQRMRCRRSASAMETRDLNPTSDDEAVPDAFDHDRRIDRDQALALCRDLRMDGIDRRLVDRIFNDSQTDETTTVGEFFDRLNASLTSSIEGVRDASGDLELEDAADDEAGVASELVVDAWERAGVPRPRRLLLELGFGAASVRPPDLDRALDDELAALAEPLDERRDARALLLAAALALARLRLRRARRRADVASAERDKLRTDVSEANRRARLLAQDVDETHARMEAELAANLRRAEARHAEAARQAAEEAAAERERAVALRAKLETETARHAEAEARLRAEAEAERARGERLEARTTAAETRAAGAEREVSRLAEELRSSQERRGAGSSSADRGQAALRELEARLEEVRREAQQLRDRNDELCGALEARASAAAPSAPRGEDAACGDLSEELRSLLSPEGIEDCDSSPTSIEQRVIDYREAARRLRDIFEGVRSAGSGAGARCEACAALAELQARVRDVSDAVILLEQPAGRTDAAVATEPDAAARCDATSQTEAALASAPRIDPQLQTLVDELNAELADAERRHEEERNKLAELISSLEASLEAMSEEYERCEEYWSRKVESERAAHEAEQRAAEARLAALGALGAGAGAGAALGAAGALGAGALGARARGPAPALPPIEERAALEAQVADLEEEFSRHRAQAEEQLRARDDELRRLRARLDALEPRRRARLHHATHATHAAHATHATHATHAAHATGDPLITTAGKSVRVRGTGGALRAAGRVAGGGPRGGARGGDAARPLRARGGGGATAARAAAGRRPAREGPLRRELPPRARAHARALTRLPLRPPDRRPAGAGAAPRQCLLNYTVCRRTTN